MNYENLSLRNKSQKMLANECCIAERIKFKNFLYCGKSLIKSRTPKKTPKENGANGLLVEVNQKGDIRALGLQTCQNSWFCPVCAPRVALKQGKRVAVAIELLENQKLVPVMLTLTIGHCVNLPLRLIYDSLSHAFKFLWDSGRRKAGCTHWQQFRRNVKIHHYMKACEVTWSKKWGWHPHFHMILWIEEKDLPILQSMENDLRNQWKSTTFNYLMKNVEKLKSYKEEFFNLRFQHATEQLENPIENLDLTESIAHLKDVLSRVYANVDDSIGLWFSKDANGNIRKCNSAMYATGWHAPDEVTSLNTKTPKQGHLTPIQILEKFCDEKNEHHDTYTSLVKEMMISLYHVSRFAWSHTKIIKMADNYLKSLDYVEYKKKFGGKQNGIILKWRVLFWLPQQRANYISNNDSLSDLIVEIARLAKSNPNINFDDVCKVFDSFGLEKPLPDFVGKFFVAA